MKTMTLLILATATLFAASAAIAAGPSGGPDIPRYGKFEASFKLAGATGNPFDPAANDVDVTFAGPNGLKVTVPAFFDGDGVWKVRFAPTEIGRYTLTVRRNGAAEHPQSLSASSFRSIPSARPGFIRIDRNHAQRFQFDNRSTYYPVGCDQAWGSQKPGEYDRMFSRMQDAGLNWARVWMNHWDNKNLEWASPSSNSPRLGEYSLPAAKHWDEIVDDADAHGIYLQVTLQHHGQVTRQVDPNWQDNPYNAAQPGGFLRNPEDFFTDPRAIALTKAKYRYIVARWGYSDHILGWELFNEIQNNPEVRDHFDSVIAWHRTMADYLRRLDPNHHLVTSSYTDPGNALERGVPLDYDQLHNYIPDVIGLFSSLKPGPGDRPWFYGEWGPSSPNWADPARSEAFLHDGLWAGIMVPVAGAQQYWYWDQIDPHNWWPQYKALTAFLKASGITREFGIVRIVPAIQCEAMGDLNFAPAMGWGTTTSFDAVLAGGAVTGMEGMSSFVQGPNHRDMMRKPLTFHMTLAQPGRFIVHIGDIAASGAHPQLILDGHPVADRDYSGTGADRNGAGETLQADVPAGTHTVGIFNTDRDWFTIRSITLTNAAPRLAATAKGDRTKAVFWAYDRMRPYQSDAPPAVVSGTLTLPAMEAGRYRVTLWDTQRGSVLGTPFTVRSAGSAVAIPIRLTDYDVAGWLERE